MKLPDDITADEFLQFVLNTKNCAPTAKQFRLIGINWPPQKGWRKRLLRQHGLLEPDEQLEVEDTFYEHPYPESRSFRCLDTTWVNGVLQKNII